MPLLGNHKAKPVRPLFSTSDGTVPGDGRRPCIRLVASSLTSLYSEHLVSTEPCSGHWGDQGHQQPLTSCEMLKIVAGVAHALAILL